MTPVPKMSRDGPESTHVIDDAEKKENVVGESGSLVGSNADSGETGTVGGCSGKRLYQQEPLSRRASSRRRDKRNRKSKVLAFFILAMASASGDAASTIASLSAAGLGGDLRDETRSMDDVPVLSGVLRPDHLLELPQQGGSNTVDANRSGRVHAEARD